MKTLILCVDRDDDFGVKAGITSPIIGRKDNLRAAISLGLKDPEDSDTNSLFAAIQLYDQLKEKGHEADIATLCGDKNVGTKSDRIISIQLETVLEWSTPDNVIMVSDGAEDEFILPLITSRVKLDSIKRVIIRQQKNIEGTLYFIAKAFQDEKVRKNFLIPTALVLLIWGIFSMVNLIEYAIGATLIALGLYILVKALHLEEPAIMVGKDIRDALRSGKIVLIATIIIALFVLAVGLWVGYINTIEKEVWTTIPVNLLIFLEYSLGFYIGAFLIYILGKTLDTYIRTGEIIRSSFSLITSAFAAWFITLALIHIFQYIFNVVEHFNFPIVMIYLFVGGLFGLISIEAYYYIKAHFPDEHAKPDAQ